MSVYRPLHVPVPEERCYSCDRRGLMGGRSDLGLCLPCICDIVADYYKEFRRQSSEDFPLTVHSPTGTRELTLHDASAAMWARGEAKRFK